MKEEASAQGDDNDSKFSSPVFEVEAPAALAYVDMKRYEADKRSQTAREEGERKERMHNRRLILAAVCHVLFTVISVPIMGN